jgi:hypothetical protein
VFDFIDVTGLSLYNLLILNNVEIVTFSTDCTSTPTRGSPSSVSPEAESRVHYGLFERSEEDGLSMVRGKEDPESKGIHICLRWPNPLDGLLDHSAGPDVLFHQAKMSNIARRSADDLAGCLQEARNMASLYVTQGEALREHVSFWPAVIAGGLDRTVKEWARQFNLPALDWKDTLGSDKWLTHMAERLEITRAWGPIGLFWSLLIDQFESRIPLTACKRCGQIIQGKRGKRYCSEVDNMNCFSARRAANKRQERERRSK